VADGSKARQSGGAGAGAGRLRTCHGHVECDPRRLPALCRV